LSSELFSFSLFSQFPQGVSSRNSFPLSTYFVLARGNADHTAMEMTKWFDTNYHYIVPEFDLESTTFRLSDDKIFSYFLEAKNELGIATKPVLLGPLTFLALGKLKSSTENTDQCSENEKDQSK